MRIKKCICLLSCSLMFSYINANAVELTDTVRLAPFVKPKKPIPSQPLVLKTSLTAFLYGGALILPLTSEYRLTAEITTGKKQSDQVSISILGTNVLWKAFEKAANISSQRVFKANGWRLEYAHKFYLVNRRHHSPYGFYVAPLFSYTDAHVSLGLNRYYKNVYFDFRHFNANAIVGVQFGKIHRLTLDMYGGLGYKNNLVYYHVNTYKIFKYDTKDFGDFYNSHLNVLFDINLGYSF